MNSAASANLQAEGAEEIGKQDMKVFSFEEGVDVSCVHDFRVTMYKRFVIHANFIFQVGSGGAFPPMSKRACEGNI
jgi:hypothetical protein